MKNSQVNPIALLALVANGFNIFDVFDGGTCCILTLEGSNYVRAKKTFQRLFEHITDLEYLGLADLLESRINQEEKHLVMPKYGDTSPEALSKINNLILLTDFCEALYLVLSAKEATKNLAMAQQKLAAA